MKKYKIDNNVDKYTIRDVFDYLRALKHIEFFKNKPQIELVINND